MSTKERILTIRLMEKISTHSAYAKTLGVEVLETSIASGHKRDPVKREG